MLALLALILCLLFVFWLLRMERRQNPTSSWTVWIPTLWMMLMSSRDIGYWFGGPDAELEAGSPFGRGVLFPLLCLALVILYKRRFDWYSALRENFWLILLLSYMFLSIFWSEASLVTCLKRWIKEMTAVVMAFLILSEADTRNALQSVFDEVYLRAHSPFSPPCRVLP